MLNIQPPQPLHKVDNVFWRVKPVAIIREKLVKLIISTLRKTQEGPGTCIKYAENTFKKGQNQLHASRAQRMRQ